MTANTGTSRGGTLFGAAAAIAAGAAGVGAVLVPVRDAAPGGLWLLVGWLTLAGAAGWCAELALARSKASKGGVSDFRTLRLDTIAHLATVLLAELTLLGARLARDHAYATAWASGGVLLALIGCASWRIRSVGGSGHTPSDNLLGVAAFAVAEACGGWLTVGFAVEGPLWAAWVLGCAMVVLAGGFWLSDSPYRGTESTYLKVFASTATLGVAGVVARSAVRGETTASWWVGGVAAGAALLIVVVPRVPSWSGSGRGVTASPGAQFAGILVPLGSLAWAMWNGKPWTGPDAGDRLLEAGWLAVSAAVLLSVQYGLLIWTSTTSPKRLASGMAQMARARYPAGNDRVDDVGGLTVLQRLLHPLQSAALTDLHRRTARATGLAVDDIWPRIELVAPTEVVRGVRRGERGVLVRRIAFASAVCTTGVWLLVALTGPAGLRVDPGVALLPVAGPLTVAALALAQARRALVEVYETKAEAVEMYRYDLAKRLRLDVPDHPSGRDMIMLAGGLSGDPHPEPYEERWRAERRAHEREELAAFVADRVRTDIRAAVRQAIREERLPQAQSTPVAVPLTDGQLTELAREIARTSEGPISARLADLQRKFHQDMQSVIRTSLTEAVTGPALTNFVGYFAIELEDSDAQDVRAEGGTIRAPAGQRLNLRVVVARDEQMRELPTLIARRAGGNFFVAEPVLVEGGRDADVVSFDVLADSATFTSLTHRKSLRVRHREQTVFGLTVPEEGNHEIWLQLYQAGHLVQVVALKVEATGATDGV
ncbi:hypothetical protein Sipo8835_43790 [Streptomyces ipomoeae]|jgi:hypothetical protein|uniref:Uncharacterized protein n=1 Tax=Streptomyces ipomoeae TaxID=103232 RepID=A0AAE9AW63_9ACTN|nr:hypothetical protein [Streptomyces ipomoeae]MDX2692407.1 hypothetical protein [Streptomyces ipomoeae]MDX2819781.1 hypothetical protein [Streptomyces ipomoeae]MDX2838069.1 hypothetical protein [Streptomyces ipomoeae]MDX2872407.1 hypothetical protein [Streptomyces ipomoeae]TQE15976.1 hypothetical protein Sipo8835_43790 [Streptomyces ipomoeae]